MRVYLGSDHAGFELKQHLVQHLLTAGHDVVDIGPAAEDPEDDFPPYCLHVADRVVNDPGSLGVVIGGSGNGEQITANKVPGIRAALAWNVATAELARSHNDANVVSLGGRMHSLEEGATIVATFVATAFSGDERHARRIAEITAYEQTRELPALPAR
jgi:ribose 5-phosphate isomerase B